MLLLARPNQPAPDQRTGFEIEASSSLFRHETILFGFRIDPAQIPGVLPIAVVLLVVASLTKVATGWWATKRAGVANRGRMRAGTALIARGEFSIVIAGLALGTGIEEDLVPLAATFVLLTAIAGPIITKFADSLAPKARPPRSDVDNRA